MTNLTINFNFPTRKNSIPFSSIPEGPFMGHFGGGATNNDMLQIKGSIYTWNAETNAAYFNGDYIDHVVYSYRPVRVTVEVDDAQRIPTIETEDDFYGPNSI